MKRIITKSFMLAVMAMLLNACNKHEHEVTPESVNIDILKPQMGLAYGLGDSVKMHIDITSPTRMHGYEMTITRLSDNIKVYSSEKDLHANEFNIREFWVYNQNCHSQMQLEIIAHIDHDGNTSRRKINFYCH